jgi:probable F420-dependent oxidoreductase
MTSKMKFGVCIPNYGDTTKVEDIVETAKMAESLGYSSVALTDHLLRPVDDQSPYTRVFESISTLSYLAALTSKVRLGISCLILPLRNPMIVAKQLATLDVLSNGRVMLAVGIGSVEEEYKIMRSNYHDRGKRQDAYIQLIRSLWRGDTSFSSKYSDYSFEGAILDPAPVQKNLEIWVAGSSKAAVMRAARFGDYWYPNALPAEELKNLIEFLHEVDPGHESKRKIAMNILIDTESDQTEFRTFMGTMRRMLSRNFERNKAIIDELEELGVSYLMLIPNPSAPKEVRLESLREFSTKIMS